MRELKKELVEIGTRSALHGMKRMLTRQFLLRLMWFVCFLASLGMLIYIAFNNIQQYLSFGFKTLVKLVPQGTVPLPQITVCNLNPLVTEEAFEYIVSYYSTTYNVTLNNYTQRSYRSYY
jgi:hypothetical protein